MVDDAARAFVGKRWTAERIRRHDEKASRLPWACSSGFEARAVVYLLGKYGTARVAKMLGCDGEALTGFILLRRDASSVVPHLRARLAHLIRDGVLA